MASDRCPNCDRPGVGSAIVALESPHGGETHYVVICGRCSVVYESRDAREQMEGDDG